MNTELNRLIEENYRVVSEMFVFGNLPIDEGREENMLCPVVSEEFQTLEQLRGYLETIYTREEADRILKEGADLGGPLYVEKEGTLYIDFNWVSGGAPEAWKAWTVEPEVLPEDRDESDFTVHVNFDIPQSDEEEEIEAFEEIRKGTYVFHAVRTAEGWRLSRMVDRPMEWKTEEKETEE